MFSCDLLCPRSPDHNSNSQRPLSSGSFLTHVWSSDTVGSIYANVPTENSFYNFSSDTSDIGERSIRNWIYSRENMLLHDVPDILYRKNFTGAIQSKHLTMNTFSCPWRPVHSRILDAVCREDFFYVQTVFECEKFYGNISCMPC